MVGGCANPWQVAHPSFSLVRPTTNVGALPFLVLEGWAATKASPVLALAFVLSRQSHESARIRLSVGPYLFHPCEAGCFEPYCAELSAFGVEYKSNKRTAFPIAAFHREQARQWQQKVAQKRANAHGNLPLNNPESYVYSGFCRKTPHPTLSSRMVRSRFGRDTFSGPSAGPISPTLEPRSESDAVKQVCSKPFVSSHLRLHCIIPKRSIMRHW